VRFVFEKVGDRRTLWLIRDTLYVEPCTVRTVERVFVRRGSLAIAEGKVSRIEVTAFTGDLRKGPDDCRKRSCCDEQRFKIYHAGGKKYGIRA
jgi:hypothetical protein